VKFRTEIDIAPGPQLQLAPPVTLLGSCFAEGIGDRLSELRLNTLVNPFGVLYNPLSIAAAITQSLDDSCDEQRLLQEQGRHFSLDAHGSFSSSSGSELHQRLKTKRLKTKKSGREPTQPTFPINRPVTRNQPLGLCQERAHYSQNRTIIKLYVRCL